MTSTLIQNASAMLTGSPEPQAHTRATDLRIEGDRITEMGSLTPRAGETVVDARGCVVYPGFVNTHHHLFQSVLKGVPAGLNVPLFEWLQSVPYRYGPYLGEEAIEIAATIGIAELLLSGCTTVADHHYLYGTNMGYDPSAWACALCCCVGGPPWAARLPPTSARPCPPNRWMFFCVRSSTARGSSTTPRPRPCAKW